MRVVSGIISFVMDILETIVFMGSMFIVVYLFILQPNQVKGASMEPTFLSGDYIFTSKVTYKFRAPERGDVIVFKSPQNPDIEYIKRIIGLPGDKIRILASGQVFVNDRLTSEPYISAKTNLTLGNFMKDNVPIVVGADEFFVMGDNRPHSSDSRYFGPIKISSVIGQVFYRYLPASSATKMGPIDNPVPVEYRNKTSYYYNPTTNMVYVSESE